MENDLIKLLNNLPSHYYTNYWNLIISNKNITLEIFDAHPEWIKHKKSLANNPNLTLKYAIENNFSVLQHPNIHPEELIDNIEKTSYNLEYGEFWDSLQQNPNITMRFILQYYDKFKDFPQGLGGTPNITLGDIEQYPELFVNKYVMSRNPNMTLQFVFDHPASQKEINNGHSWFWHHIARSPKVTFEDVKCFPQLFDNQEFMEGLSLNPNITPKIYKENSSLSWFTYNICKNPSFTIQDLQEIFNDLDEDDFYDYISQNPNLTADFILENINQDWDFLEIFRNEFKAHPYFEEPIIIRV